MLTDSATSGALQLSGMWDTFTQPGALPRSVVLSANRFTESNKRHLSTVDFFSNVSPVGPAASPLGGSIKAVRVYNHGACSAETLTAPGGMVGLLDRVSESVWKGFVEGVIVEDGECKEARKPFRFSSSAVNYLDHTPRETRDLRGGFFLHFDYYADLPLSPVVPDIYTTVTARYEYTLVDGILGLRDTRVFQYTTGPSWANPGAKMLDSLTETAPAKFAELARAEQTTKIIKDEKFAWATACDPTGSYQCEGAASIAGSAVKKGAETLQKLGEESFSTQDQNKLSDAMMRRVNEDAPLTDWVCVPDNSENGGHCEFTVPAKRLNVYPDAVELVWFDGKEVKNPAYALYVMAHFSEKNDPTTGMPIFDQEAVDELCSFDLPWVAPPRKFTISTLMPTDAEYLRPEICSAIGTGGECSFRAVPASRTAWPALAAVSLALALARRRMRSGGAPS
jgi:hypothetical protein